MMAEPPPEGTSNTFTGGAEAIIQTGPVHGDVHLHRPALAKFPPPRQLPMDVPRFVNRDEQLAALDAVLTATEDDTRSATVVVSAVAGAPGVGKTTLAVHWAHRVRHRFPDGDLYVNLRGYGPRSALPTDQALEFFLRALDVAPERVPIGTEPRAALYRSLLNGLRVLVIIDNAASASQVRPLLPVASTCLAVVTSRDRLSGLIVREGAAPVVLDVLTPDESFDLLRQVVGAQRVDAEPAAAARIARQCGYLPLALRIVAERLAGRPYMTLSEIGNELDDERSRLDALTSDDELADVRAVFSWSYGALTPDVARLFRLLGLHTGADISTPAVAALTGTTLTRVRRLLDVLTGAHLLQQTAAARYRLHDLLRTYVAERAEVDEPPDQRRRALRRVLRWYLLTAANARREFLPDLDPRVLEPTDEDDPTDPQVFAGVDEAMAWFEAERLNLLDALEQAVASGQNDLAVKIPRAIGGFFEVRAYWRDYQYVYRHGLQASRMMGDHYWELSSLVGLGDAERVLRRYDEAVDYYSQAVRISEEIGDQRREGFALRGMGMVHQERGQYDRAVEYYQLALSRSRELAFAGARECVAQFG